MFFGLYWLADDCAVEVLAVGVSLVKCLGEYLNVVHVLTRFITRRGRCYFERSVSAFVASCMCALSPGELAGKRAMQSTVYPCGWTEFVFEWR